MFAIVACSSVPRKPFGPEVRSQTCPTSGLDPEGGSRTQPGIRVAIESHTKLHGEYELLCGRSMDDPAVAVLRELPQVRVIECRTVTPNQKVGVLIDLAHEAKHPTLVVNDADIAWSRIIWLA